MKRCYLRTMVMLLFFLAMSGFVSAGSISGRFWIDSNGNGYRDAGDTPVVDADVVLYDKKDHLVLYQQTDPINGEYSFTNVPKDNGYYLVFTMPGDKVADYEFFKSPKNTDESVDSDVDATGKTGSININSDGQSETNIDAGIRLKNSPPLLGSIGNWVWLDTNDDGTQDNTQESGKDNVLVKLYKLNTSSQQYEFAADITTHGGGYYVFSNLAAGDYYVQFVAPQGYKFGKKTGNLDKTDNSDADDNGKTVNFSLEEGENNLNVDAALIEDVSQKGSIGDLVWLDEDKDGLKGSGEHGINDVAVDLYLIDNGSPVWKAQTHTNGSGKYSFSDLLSGTYEVKFTLPDDSYQFTKIVGVTDDDDNSDADNEGKVKNIPLTAGQNRVNIDAGLLVKEAPPATGSIGDFVWNDENKNGIQDESGNPGIKDVKVELYSHSSSGDTYVTETTTNGSGQYKFDKVSAGTYRVKFYLTTEYDHFTTKGANLEDGNNSDADPSNDGFTASFDLAAGENRENVDAGMVAKEVPPATGSIGDLVWVDTDKSGIKDNGENGLKDVTVDLYMYQTGVTDPVWKQNTTTNGSGKYLFSDLDAGTYLVKFTLPDGYEFTKIVGVTDDDDNSDADNEGKVKNIGLAPGQNRVNIDAGMLVKEAPPATGSIGDFVWNDENKNGIQDESGNPGIKDVKVELYSHTAGGDTYITETTTNGSGQYKFDKVDAGSYRVKFYLASGFDQFTSKGLNLEDGNNSDADPADGFTSPFTLAAGENRENVDAGMIETVVPPAKGSIGDLVWVDTDKSGIKDNGENGLKDVIVDLYLYQTGVTDPVWKEQTTTNGSGKYLFQDLEAGTYLVKFTLPQGYEFTSMVGVQDDDDNSDADKNNNGKTKDIILAAGQNRVNIDAGLFLQVPDGNPNPQINGILWFDANGDGFQGGVSTEPGIGNWTVKLLAENKTTVVATTTTDNSGIAGQQGRYSFTHLTAGTYYLLFVKPAGYTFTLQNAANDNRDSDVNSLGYSDAVAITDNAQQEHVDAGVYLTEQPPSGNGKISGRLWDDTVDKDGLQDGINNEPGIGGQTVKLFLSDGTLYKTTTTASSGGLGVIGTYKFDNVAAGSYYLHFSLPSGFTFTIKDADHNDQKDSDADKTTGRTNDITITSNAEITHIDAGAIKGNTRKGSIGNQVWFDNDCDGLQDLPEKGEAWVGVRLYAYNDGHSDFIRGTMTDQYGLYSFSNLEAGTYRVKFVLPDDFEKFTIKDAEENSYDKKDSDADQFGWTDPITLSAGEINRDVDAGLCKAIVKKANLGDYVWNDCNRNGIQDVGESGIGGVEVKLHSCLSDHSKPDVPCGCGNVVASVKTDKNGKYMFTDIMPGYYCVEIVVPCNFTITKPDQAEDFKDSDIIPSLKHTACIKLNPGETNLTVDAGLYPTPPATLGDLVWIDANKNGIQDKGEKGLCNVTVELYMCGVSKPVAAAKTDTDGKYTFRDILPNTSYSVKFSLPKGYAFTAIDQGNNDNFDSDVCPKNNGMTKFYDVMPDETNLSIDCGMYLATTSACNYVWKDNNNNGLKDEGEAGIQGVTVELYNCSNNSLVQSAKTDAAGLFTFKDILLESYYMKIQVPEGYKIGKTSQEGGAQGLNTDYGANGQSACFDVTDGTTSIGRPVALVLSTTGVKRGAEVPTEFTLEQNYPNPFNPSTTIEFAVPSAGQYTLKVFNTLGQEVATLLDRELSIGYHMVVFDASKLTSGMYIYRLSGSNVVLTKKMMLSK